MSTTTEENVRAASNATWPQAVLVNVRQATWKYWAFLAVWETAAISISVASVIGGTTPLNSEFIGWSSFFIVFPALPILIPMPVQMLIGSGLSALFALLITAGILWIAGGYVVVLIASDSPWAYAWRYSLEKDMTGMTLAVDPRPHDCEFLTAPLGAKHCHYEKHVSTIRVRASADGHLVSVDDGRTWQATADRTQPVVSVSWERVLD